jgi:hypothetical protein
MSTNKTILRNRHGAEVAAIFFDEDSRRWRIVSKVGRISSAISLPRRKRSMHGTPISIPRQENFAKNEVLVRRTSRLGSNETRAPEAVASCRSQKGVSQQLRKAPLYLLHLQNRRSCVFSGTPIHQRLAGTATPAHVHPDSTCEAAASARIWTC